MPPKPVELSDQVPINTLNRSKCLQESKIRSHVQSFVGSGSYGSVFTYCSDRERKKAKCKYVLKIQRFEGVDPICPYFRETFYHSYIQKHATVRIVPKLWDHWTCTSPDMQSKESIGAGFMILDKWDGDIDHKRLDAFELELLVMAFENWLPELTRLHVYHNDIHGRNILWRDTGRRTPFGLKILEFALTDWGLAMVETNEKTLEKFYRKDFVDILESFAYGKRNTRSGSQESDTSI